MRSLPLDVLILNACACLDGGSRDPEDRRILAVRGHGRVLVWEAWERWDGAVGILLWGRLKRPMSLMVGGSSSFVLSLMVLHSSCAHVFLRHALLVFGVYAHIMCF